jgi:lysylphosphatidylglycerol synthetase-like protein (DUF2156 family)
MSFLCFMFFSFTDNIRYDAVVAPIVADIVREVKKTYNIIWCNIQKNDHMIATLITLRLTFHTLIYLFMKLKYVAHDIVAYIFIKMANNNWTHGKKIIE